MNDTKNCKYYRDLIEEALKNVDSRFYKINAAVSYHESQAVEKIVRERYFCYELYHQMRCLDDKIKYFHDDIIISPEIDKKGYKLIKNNRIPDIIIHEPGVMDNNILVAEVKGTLDISGIAKDINTLSIFLNDCYYKYAIFILYNHSLEELKEKLENIKDKEYYKSIKNKKCFDKIEVMCKKHDKSEKIESKYLNKLILP